MNIRICLTIAGICAAIPAALVACFFAPLMFLEIGMRQPLGPYPAIYIVPACLALVFVSFSAAGWDEAISRVFLCAAAFGAVIGIIPIWMLLAVKHVEPIPYIILAVMFYIGKASE